MATENADALMRTTAQDLAKAVSDPNFLGEGRYRVDPIAVWHWAEAAGRIDILAAIALAYPAPRDKIWKTKVQAWANQARDEGKLQVRAGFLEGLVSLEQDSARRLLLWKKSVNSIPTSAR